MTKETSNTNENDGRNSQTHDRPPDLVKKIGKTTYLVRVHFSQTSRETLEDKIKRMLRDDVRRIMQAEASM